KSLQANFGGSYAGDTKDTADFKFVTYDATPAFGPEHKIPSDEDAIEKVYGELYSDVEEHGVHPLLSAATKLLMDALPHKCPNATQRNDVIVLESYNKGEGHVSDESRVLEIMGHLYKTNHLQRNFFKNCSEVAIKAVLDSGKFDLAFTEAEIPSVHAKMKRVWKSLSEDEKTQAEQGYWWAIGRLRPDAAMRLAGLFECTTHSSTSSGVITVQVNIERARMVFGLLGLGPSSDKRRQYRFLGLKVPDAVTAEDKYTDALFGGAARQLRVKRSIEEKLLQRRAYMKAYSEVYRSEHKEYYAVKGAQWHATAVSPTR
ncbi:hypothetical protein B484DRAFT_390689, partial [Ochromonadaceae sp. CCMP2298]